MKAIIIAASIATLAGIAYTLVWAWQYDHPTFTLPTTELRP